MIGSPPQQRAYLAHWLTLTGKAEDSLTQVIAGAKVDMNPHQVEAALVPAQKWAERRRKLLLTWIEEAR